MKFNFLLSFAFLALLTCGCSQMKQYSFGKSEYLYPPENTIIKYHTDWAKNNYKVRIKQFENDPLNYGDIVFLGNSITQLGKDWSARFGIKNVRNRGIAGDVTDGVLLRLREITHFKPKAVFLLIGINDIYNFHDKKEIPSSGYVGNNILEIAGNIHKASPKTKIYIQTILPTSKEYLREIIDSVNIVIKQNEKRGFYKVIDLHPLFTNEQGLFKKDLTTDGTHLTEKGYQVWGDFIKPLVVTGKDVVENVYPGGKNKSLILSFDDGIVDDVKLVKLFNDKHLIGTFNLNSGYLGTIQPWKQRSGDTLYQKYISRDSLCIVYKNHEIASHSTSHKNFTQLSDEDILKEVNSDVYNLGIATGHEIKSFAYPFGATNQHVANLLMNTKVTNARTVKESKSFDLPKNYLLWNPTCRFTNALECLTKYDSIQSDSMTVFYVWGHSWELRDQSKWDKMELFCKKISDRKDMWYVGCSEFVDYQLSLKRLKITEHYIFNPKGNNKVWLKINGVLRVLNPNEKIKITS